MGYHNHPQSIYDGCLNPEFSWSNVKSPLIKIQCLMLKSQFSVLKSLKSHKIFHLQIMFPLKPPFLHASPSYKPPFNWGFPNFWPQIHLRWRPVSQHAFGASCAHRCRNLQRWPGLCCTLRCRCRCFWWQGQNKKPWKMHVSIHRFAHMEVRRVFFFRGFCNHNIEATIFWNSGQILPSPGTLWGAQWPNCQCGEQSNMWWLR